MKSLIKKLVALVQGHWYLIIMIMVISLILFLYNQIW